MTFPNGAHVVEVEIDRDTGRVDAGALHRGRRLRRDGESDDRRPGRRMAPWRRARARPCWRARDLRSGFGQMLAGSFMDYALPRADDLPSFDVGFNGNALHDQSAGREGLRRGGRDRGLPGHRQRHPRRPGAARREGLRRPGDAGAHLAGHAGRPDETPRARDGAQSPAHPRRPAAATTGQRAWCSKSPAARASMPCTSPPTCRSSCSSPAIPTTRRCGQHRCLGGSERAFEHPAGGGARRRGAGLAGRSRPTPCSACNMIHIAPWTAAVGLVAGAARILPDHGLLYLYGPVPPRRPAHGAEQREPSTATSRRR